ncbi:hypothetical protein [Acinetobacter baumannii]|uniref:hypothetical protein n=1 Tax=Acinetobacter baumannii TaxID=470 RepID=UPI00280DE5F2|nr:hypothetical protein [Acinetobacter baumannii]MDQ8938156.1 hypothetical protein [Acinetobacter baumannii]MDQ9851935.1 hypothetical protein [Acinetobacter baumannii]
MKNHILKLIIFLSLWAFIYWISKENFGVLSFLIAYLFVYSIGKDALLLLANEFDNHHNNLTSNVIDLSEKIENLSEENEQLKGEIDNLRDLIYELKNPKVKGFDDFYDYIDKIENEKKNLP